MCFLNIFDVFSTYVILELEHCEEANPYVSYLIQEIGFWKAMIVAKLPPFILVFVAVYMVIKQKRKWLFLLLSICLVDVIYLYFMVTRNLAVLIQELGSVAQ